MFTGIVEEIGKIRNLSQNFIEVECEKVLADTKIGDSIAVDGVCLTVTNLEKDFFKADVSPETYKVTNFSSLKKGSFVNLERAMPANGRFGGHVVSGHIDGIGKLIELSNVNDFYNLVIEIKPNESKYVIKKGSISINGISLTVAETEGNFVKLAIIPHTFLNTNLQYLIKGDIINIEVDVLSKYVEKFLSTSDNKSRLNMNFLQENGFC